MASGTLAGLTTLLEAAAASGADVTVAGVGAAPSGLPGPWTALPDRAALAGFVGQELRRSSAADDIVRLLVTDDAGLGDGALEHGFLPVLLDERDTSWPAESGRLVLQDAARLVPYFTERPEGLGRLLSATAAATADVHEAVAGRFAAALAGGGRLFVFGSGTVGRQLARALRGGGLEPSGFLDNDPAAAGRRLEGLTVSGPDGLDPGRDVVVVAVGGHAAAVAGQLRDLGAVHVFNLSEAHYVLQVATEPESAFAADLDAHRLDYEALYTLLADEASRATLEAVVEHRLSLDTGPLARVCVKDQPQWFDAEVVPQRDDHALVDCGAFDGDTVGSFSEAFGGRFACAFAFEPDAALAAGARERFAGDPRVTVRAAGVSGAPGSMTFGVTGATDGRLHASATTLPQGRVVDVVTIDDAVPGPVTMIKLDVEGAEADALRGAERRIRSDAPVLAVAVYHQAQDVWALARQILDLRADYRLCLRHYTELSYETVLYAVPEEGERH